MHPIPGGRRFNAANDNNSYDFPSFNMMLFYLKTISNIINDNSISYVDDDVLETI